MSRFRDFDAARAESEPIRFRLGGELFELACVLPAGPLLDMARAKTDDEAIPALVAFFEAIVADDDTERFAAAIRRSDIRTLAEAQAWIIAEATGRPLPNASPSAALPSESGVSWKNTQPEPVGTP